MCGFSDPKGCLSDIADGITGKVFEMFANGARDMLKTTSTFWMEVPSPTTASGSGQNWEGNQTIMEVQGSLAPVALVIFTLCVGSVLIKVAYDTSKAGEGFNSFARALVATLAGGLPVLAVTMLGIQFGDLFSPWILSEASGEDTSDGFQAMLLTAFLGGANGVPAVSGALLLIYIVAILGSLMQCIFMVVRGAAIIVLLCFAQVTAAGASTEEGWLRFKRLCMLLVGFVLYKPVAAVVYAVGLRLLSDSGDDQIMSAVYGLTVILMAALALPALIKFVAPAAAMGSSGAFSGGAAVGAVATGAAVVAVAGATGGAGAGAAGAAGAAGGGSGGGGGGVPDGGGSPGAQEPSPGTGGPDGDSGRGGDSGSDGSSDSGRETGADPSKGNPSQAKPSPGAPDTPPQGAPDSGPAGGGGSSSGGAAAQGTQMGAQTVQSLSNQMNQAGDDASRE